MIYLTYRKAIYQTLIKGGHAVEHRQGPLTEALFYILLAARRPIHGYGIIQEVAEMTAGQVTLGPGTLYGAINLLLERGWIVLYSAEVGSRKKKEYVITDQGREVFAAELRRLRTMAENGKKMEDDL